MIRWITCLLLLCPLVIGGAGLRSSEASPRRGRRVVRALRQRVAAFSRLPSRLRGRLRAVRRTRTRSRARPRWRRPTSASKHERSKASTTNELERLFVAGDKQGHAKPGHAKADSAAQSKTAPEKKIGKLAKLKALAAGAKRGAKKLGRWVRKNPRQAIGLSLGAVAMLGTVFYAAPALSVAVSGWLAPSIGTTGSVIAGVAAGGGLASGARSLLVHVTPMVAGIDPFNRKQLATDTSLSATFGFFGFAHAAALKSFTTLAGVSGVGLFALNYVGLVGYELGKDYLQNRIRNRVANDPKRFRDIWHKSLAMETVSNLHRCIPGLNLETNFGAKILGDVGGTIWWDRIINKRNDPSAKAKTHSSRAGPAHDALTE